MLTSMPADKTMRLNLGHPAAPGPLLDNDRRRIELMNGMLFSLPGTPIIYYGDEIGRGTISTWEIAPECDSDAVDGGLEWRLFDG